MADTYTNTLTLRKKEPGTLFTAREAFRGVGVNSFAGAINSDLDKIDAAIGEVCSPEQVAAIRERLKDQLQFFWVREDGIRKDS